MSRSRLELRLALLFVASQAALWTGCNAILGNGYGAFDESAAGEGGTSGEGSTEGDALVGGEGGPGGDATGLGDGSGGDGNVLDGSVDGGSCPRGICPTMLTAASGAQRIALGTTASVDYVYWVSATSVGRVGIDSSGPKALVLDSPIAPPLKRGIAVSQAGIPYVTVPLRGASKCLADLTSCANGFIGSAGASSSVAVDASSIYVGIADDGSGGGGIYRTTDLNGSMPTAYTMSDKVLDFQVVPPTTFYRTSTLINHTTPMTTPALSANPGAAPVAFSVSGTMMVIATSTQLLTCTLNGAGVCSTPGVVAITAGIPSAVLLFGTHILWAESGNGGSIHRCDFPMCANSVLLAENQASPGDLAADTSSIYWANHGDAMGTGGAIMKLSQ